MLKSTRQEQRDLQKEFESTSNAVTPYRQLSAELTVNRNRLKDLLALQAQNVKLTDQQAREAEALAVEVRELDQTLKDIDSQTGQNFRNVGNYEDAFKSAINSITPGLGGILSGLSAIGIETEGITDKYFRRGCIWRYNRSI